MENPGMQTKTESQANAKLHTAGERPAALLKQENKTSAVKSMVLDKMHLFQSGAELSKSEVQKCRQPVSRTENDVGITEYIDSSQGFTGITKHRWSDFIVHEVNQAGEVATVTDLSIPVVESSTTETARPDWFPEYVWNKVSNICSSVNAGDFVHIPAAQLSKEDRTKYHETIKSCFSILITNTVEVDGEKVISVRKSNDVPDKKNTFWKHKPWPKDRPKFLHFCMFKENVDTFTALSMLSMDLKIKSNKFHIAGTKDARAKTTQNVAIKQITAEQVHQAASKFRKVLVGNFRYHDDQLKLGDLKGNQFDIVLRHIQGSDEVVSRRIASFSDRGFINYYGMQRFGTTTSATHLVGRAILRKEWRAAVDLLLSGQEDAAGGVSAAQRAWRADRDPRRAFALLSGRQKRTTIEGRVLHTLCSIRATAYQEAVDRLPSNTRQLYVHAYQSWLWNRLVSRRLVAHGLVLRPGDLVLCGKYEQLEPDADTAPEDDDRVDVPLADDETPPAPPSVAATDFLPAVHALTAAELPEHTIGDMVVPLPGWAVTLPNSEMSGWYGELLAADGVELSRAYCDSLRQYNLAGAYRRVVVKPSFLSWQLERYSNPAGDLLLSDADRLLGRTRLPPSHAGEGAVGPHRALVLQFQLPSSCYATMALRELTGADSSLAAQMTLNDAYNAEIRRGRDGGGGDTVRTTVDHPPAGMEHPPVAVESATAHPESVTMGSPPATVEAAPATVELTPAAVEAPQTIVEPAPTAVEPATVQPSPATVEPAPAAAETTTDAGAERSATVVEVTATPGNTSEASDEQPLVRNCSQSEKRCLENDTENPAKKLKQ